MKIAALTTPLLALAVSFLVLGCAQVRRPDQNLEERLGYDQRAVQDQYQLETDWWKGYQDRQLDGLVNRALANNVDLAKAAVSVNRALFQANLLGADLAPSFSGGLDGSARKNIRRGGPSTRSAGGDLSVSYEVDLWRKVADAVSAAQWEYKATVEDRDAARLALVGSVVDGYFHLAYLEDAIASARKNLQNYRAIEQTVLAKHQAGKVAAVEPAQARQSVLTAENSLADYLTQKKGAEQTLRDLLNLKPDESLELKTPTLAKRKLPGVDLSVPLAVLANRPDLKAAEFRLEKAFKNVREAEKAWLPSISLSAALSSSGENLKTAFNAPVAAGAISINLPFLDWNRVLWNLRISETDFENVRLDFEKALTTALNEVDTYYYTYTQSRRTLKNTRAKYAADLKISAYYRDRYQAGSGELSDWLNALSTVNSSHLAVLNSLYQTIQYENLTHKAMAGRYKKKL